MILWQEMKYEIRQNPVRDDVMIEDIRCGDLEIWECGDVENRLLSQQVDRFVSFYGWYKRKSPVRDDIMVENENMKRYDRIPLGMEFWQ